MELNIGPRITSLDCACGYLPTYEFSEILNKFFLSRSVYNNSAKNYNAAIIYFYSSFCFACIVCVLL